MASYLNVQNSLNHILLQNIQKFKLIKRNLQTLINIWGNQQQAYTNYTIYMSIHKFKDIFK